MTLKNNAPISWNDIFSDIDKKHKLISRIIKIGNNNSPNPSPYTLILKGEFQQFGETLEAIINDFLKFQEYVVKAQKLREAIELKMIYSRPYSFEVAETKAIEILEYVELRKLPIECCIKKIVNF